MQPIIGGISSYYFMWGMAAIACLLLGIDLAQRDGDVARRLACGAFLFGVIAVGAKGLYLLEARLFPADDYVPLELRGALHGFRIPGGIALLVLTMPAAVRLARLPWPDFGDKFVILPAAMLIFVRAGCFLNGCCFGRRSSGALAVTFPAGSWTHYYHASHGWIAPHAPRSLPVIPLQLCFLAAAAAMLAVLLWIQGSKVRPGTSTCAFYSMFFGSSLLLENARENYLTLNNWILWPAAAFAAVLLVHTYRLANRAAVVARMR